MSLAQACREVFPVRDRQRGEEYFAEELVEVIDQGDRTAECEVEGSDYEPYTVELDWRDLKAGVAGSCTCPRFDDAGICKHLWAALRTIDRLGLTRGVKIPARVAFNSDDDDVFNTEPSPPVANRMSEKALAALRRTIGERVAKQKPSAPPNWQTHFAKQPLVTKSLSESQHHWLQLGADKATRLVYVLDIEQTAQQSAPVIQVVEQPQLKTGSWGKPRSIALFRDRLEGVTPVDRAILLELLGNKRNEYLTSRYGGWGYGQSEGGSQFTLSSHRQAELLAAMCATERAYLGGNGQIALGEDVQPLTWLTGEPLAYRIVARRDAKQKAWKLRGEYLRDGASTEELRPILILASGLAVGSGWVGMWDQQCDFRWLSTLNSQEELSVPFADREKLLTELWRGGQAPTIVGDPQLQICAEVGQPQPRLQEHPNTPSRGRYSTPNPALDLTADVKFHYGEREISPAAQDQAWVEAGAKVATLRNHQREGELLAELHALGVTHKKPDYYGQTPKGNIQFAAKLLPTIVQHLVDRGWHVEADKALYRKLGEFKQSVTSGVDWFDLETTLDFDGVSASLPQLLAALKQGEKYVTLDDGTRGILPQEWLERVAPLAEFGEVADGKLRFKPSQALLLDALLASREDDVQFECDQQFRKLRNKLQSFTGVKPRKPSKTFRGELRPYQQLGLGWLEFLADHRLGGCLADDMGLGKTVQVLARLEQRRLELVKNPEERRPSLAVVPKSLVYNWKLEAEKFAPKLNVIDYHGNDRQARCGDLTQYDLVVTTYGTLLRDIEVLRKQPFDYVILDESQAIKNNTSQSAKAVRLLDGRHRLAMSGTPVENHLGELWSLFEFLNPGMLGRSEAFRGLGRNGGSPEQMELLRRGIAPFLLRRTKGQVLADLPAKTEQKMYCDLEPPQRKLYNQLRDHYRASLLKTVGANGIKKSQIQVLEALLRLRQAACHPGLLDAKQLKKPSAKLDTLFEQLDEVVEEGHKVLIFSQFTSLLAIVKQQLDAKKITYEYLDGKTRNRQQKVDRFQTDPACPLFLISLKAGGVGLNLTAADYVYLLDPWWNPAVESQAIDRAHRIGQQKPVFAYRLIARDTVEDKILELQSRKRDLADAIIAADGGLVSQMTAEDLQLLLS